MSYTSLAYHIVFSTKERRAFLRPEIRERVRDYIGGIVRNMKCQLLAGDGMDDHLHLVVLAHPTVAPSDLLRTIKANSSKWIHDTFENLATFSWQDEYSAFSVSKSALSDVIAYVQGQGEHHKKMTFQEELVALLEKHGIEYDQRYILR